MIKLDIKGLDKLSKELDKEMKGLFSKKWLTIGVHSDKAQRENKKGVKNQLNNAQIGAVNHFGAEFTVNLKAGGTKTITIPPRPWLDAGIVAGSKEIHQALQDAVDDGEKGDKLLETIGLTAVAEVQDYMNKLSSPRNADATIKAKGFNNPLIHTGELKQSVHYKVGKNKPKEGL